MPLSDESEIRALIERWADAVHAGDLEGFSPTTPTIS
jgi:ketosteroid isomerase-like protein